MTAIRIRITVIFLPVLLLWVGCSSPKGHDFAIVTDKSSFDAAGTEIELYASVLREEGLNPVIIIDIWNHPDSIRNVLMNLYHDNPVFEGAVFIGEIPIPMLRDAQHMTSAFKMDQERYPWGRSSVASDRFYEDFDLLFDYIRQDTVQTLYHYYSLRHDSPQKLVPEIYSGRIRIPWDEDFSLLKAYLRKVVAAHQANHTVENVMLFAGHGYNSESMTARIDERAALLQQFPQLWRQNNGFDYIDFDFDTHIKHRLLSTMAVKDFDLALLHHHGSKDAQLVDGEPSPNGVQASIESVKYYLRSKVRGNKDPEAAIQYYMEWLGVPSSWFDLTFDKTQTVKDSIFYWDMDIMAIDIEKYFPRARFIMFDACFNGSFYVDDYITGHHVFGNSLAVAAQANTVNAIQDKFPDEMAGLLSLGIRVGEWNKNVCFLETHIVGDPTFRFRSTGDIEFDDLKRVAKNTSQLIKLTDYPHPDVQAWALRQLYNINYSGISDLVAGKYFSSTYFVTRMECLKILSFIRDDNFIKVAGASMSDSYELVRRLGANYAWKSGHPDLIKPLVAAYAYPNVSKRESYQLRDGLGFFNSDELFYALSELYKAIDTTGNHFGAIYSSVSDDIFKLTNSAQRTIGEVTSAETTDRDRLFSIRSLRNKTYHTGLDELLAFLDVCENDDMVHYLTEALGWFEYSYRRDEIIRACQRLAESEERGESVRNEAVKTISRLK